MHSAGGSGLSWTTAQHADFKRETYIRHFIRFDRWCAEKQPGQDLLSREIVHGWIDDDKAPCHELSHRAAAMRLFGRYLLLGEDAYVLPDKYTPIKAIFAVFVFTDAELSALFESIDFLVPTKKEPFLNEIVSVLFRLIYTCGLRPERGRELLAENVFLDTGAVLITHTKRNKERFVVMSDDMVALARRYDQRRRIFGGGPLFFFRQPEAARCQRKIYPFRAQHGLVACGH